MRHQWPNVESVILTLILYFGERENKLMLENCEKMCAKWMLEWLSVFPEWDVKKQFKTGTVRIGIDTSDELGLMGSARF